MDLSLQVLDLRVVLISISGVLVELFEQQLEAGEILGEFELLSHGVNAE